MDIDRRIYMFRAFLHDVTNLATIVESDATNLLMHAKLKNDDECRQSAERIHSIAVDIKTHIALMRNSGMAEYGTITCDLLRDVLRPVLASSRGDDVTLRVNDSIRDAPRVYVDISLANELFMDLVEVANGGRITCAASHCDSRVTFALEVSCQKKPNRHAMDSLSTYVGLMDSSGSVQPNDSNGVALRFSLLRSTQ
jgi:hypothetical protein